MSSVDNRVVRMTFDNSQFEKEIARSQTSLGNLDKTLGNLGGKDLGSGFGQGLFSRIKDALYSLSKTSSFAFSGIQSAEASFTTGHMVSALDALENRFSSMGVVGMSILDNFGDKLFEIGTKALKALPDAIIGGGYKRAMAIENARFTLQGLVDDEKEVEAIMNDAKASVDGTAYAYNDAATAAANFAATGMGSGDQMLHTLQGIAGTAATVNADYSDIAHIFTTIAGNGRVMGEQLNQFSYRGLNAAATVSKSFNEVIDGTSTMSEKAQQRVKNIISEGAKDIKNTSKITEEDIRKLASQGLLDFETFGEIMFDRFGEHAKKANDTFKGSMANIKAALARTGEMFFSGLIVQKGPLVRLFNAVRESVNAFNNQLKEAFGYDDDHPYAIAWTNFVTKLADGATTIVKAFTENGGIEGIGNIIKGIGSVLKPIGQAFDAIFGYVDSRTGAQVSGIQHIAEMITKLNEPFKEFTQSLILNEDAQKKLQAVMEIVFDILKVGAVIIKNIVMIAGSILNVIWKIIGAIADFIGTIFYILNGGRRAVDILEILSTAIDFLGVVIRSVIRGVGKVIDWIAGKLNKLYSFIMGFVDAGSGHVGAFFTSLASNFRELGAAIKLSISQDSLKPFADYILSKFPKVQKAISDLHGSLWNFKEVMRIKWQTKGILIVRAKIYQLKKAWEELAPKIAYALTHIEKVPGMIKEKFKNLGPVLSSLRQSFSALGDTMAEKFGNFKSGFLEKLDAFVSKIKGAFSKIKELFSGLSFYDVMGKITSVGLLGYFVYMLKMFRDITKAIKSFSKIATLPAKVAGVLGELKDTLKAYQKELYASAIMKIAIAIGVLAAALWVLSKVPADKLKPAILAIGALMIMLGGAMKFLTTLSFTAGGLSLGKGKFSFKPAAITQLVMAMIPMAAAILMLGRVVKKFGEMEWDQLARGLVGVTVCFIELGAMMYFFTRLVNGSEQGKKGMLTTEKSVARLTQTIGAMVPLAIAAWIIGDAVARLGKLDPGQITQGLICIGLILTGMAVFTRAVNEKTIDMKSAASMVIIAGVLYLLAGAIVIYAYIPWDMFLFGLAKIAGALAAIGGVLRVFPKEKAIQSATAFAIVSAALYLLGGAIIFFGLIPIELFCMGLLKVCLALAALAFVMELFSKGKKMMKFAKALVVLGAALIVMGAGFLVFSQVPIWGIIKGVIALVAVLFILGVAGAVLIEFVPAIYLLCGALALFGVSVALIGAGFALLAWGFTMIGAAGTAGAATTVAALTILLDGLAAMIPQIATILVTGMLAVAQMLASQAPAFAKAFTDFVYAFIAATSELRVRLQELAFEMMTGMADVIIRKAPELGMKLTQAAIAIVYGLVPGIQAMGQAMTDLIIAMMTSLKDHIVDVTVAGADLAVALVEGIADGLENAATRMEPAMVKLKNAIIHFFKAVFGIHSPSTVMSDLADSGIGGGISEGITNFANSGELNKVMGTLGDSLSDGFTGWIEGGGIRNMVNKFGNAFGKALFMHSDEAKQYGAQFAEDYARNYGQTLQNNVNGWQLITGAGNAYQMTATQEMHMKLVGSEYAGAITNSFMSTFTTNLKNSDSEIGKTLNDLFNRAKSQTAPGAASFGFSLGSSFLSNMLGSMGQQRKQQQIAQAASNAVTKAKSLASAAISGVSNIGSNMISGMARGASQTSGTLYSTIQTIVRITVAKAKLAAKISSPSRVFADEVGQYIPLGIAMGMYKRADSVGNASEAIIRNAVSTASVLASRLSKAVEEDLDSYPVITPVIDMTDVISKSDDISNMIGGAYALAMSSNIISNRRRAQDAALANMASSGNVVNQYNNMKIVQQPGESMDVFVDRVVGKLETATNMEG